MVTSRTTLAGLGCALAAMMVVPAASQPPSRPEQPTRAEQLLEDYVFVRLADRAWAGGDFEVSADAGTVTIRGTVPSERARRRAVRIVRRTFGVTAVRDQLRIDPASAAPAPGATVPGHELARRVAKHIAATLSGAKVGEDWWLTGWRVEGPDNRWRFIVEADRGDVWLDGTVPQYHLIRQAVVAAREVPGVRSVRSDLEIDRAYAYPPGRFFGYAHDAYPYGAFTYPYPPPD